MASVDSEAQPQPLCLMDSGHGGVLAPCCQVHERTVGMGAAGAMGTGCLQEV